jgi:hypothetical protein
MFKRTLLPLSVLMFALTGWASTAASAGPTGSGPASSAGSSRATTERADCPNPHGGSCLGNLEPGTYKTSTFKPKITYTVPAGWTNFEDLPGNFWLFQQQDSQDGELGGSYLGIYQNVNAAAIDCTEGAQEGVGNTPAELVAWYQSIPGLTVSNPTKVTVGGLQGLQIDLDLQPGGSTCSYGPYQGIPLIIGNGVSSLHHVILDELDLRLVILGWRGGNVTLEITNVHKQHTAEEFRDALQPIINSLKFHG